MKEQLEQFVKHVKDNSEFCKGNEAMTRSSLIAPLFDQLGWNMTNPRECHPEYRADFGKGAKSAKPVDWAFAIDKIFAFIVEAKECGVKLHKHGKTYAEQLGMYFNKIRTEQHSFCLGIYTNGIHWQFFTNQDDGGGVMDKEPFLSWSILEDDPIPVDFLVLLQRSQFKPQLIKTFAEQGKKQNLLVQELAKLLDPPSSDFIKMAVQNIESATLTVKVVEQWRPILTNAIKEWAKLKVMGMAVLAGSDKQSKQQDEDEPESDTEGEVGKKKEFKGKTCPTCGKGGQGYKTKVCACGHAFVFKKKEEEQEPETQWHYASNNKQKVGPVSLAELKEAVASGRLKPTDMVLQEGQKQWVPASTIPGLYPPTTLPFVGKDAL